MRTARGVDAVRAQARVSACVCVCLFCVFECGALSQAGKIGLSGLRTARAQQQRGARTTMPHWSPIRSAALPVTKLELRAAPAEIGHSFPPRTPAVMAAEKKKEEAKKVVPLDESDIKILQSYVSQRGGARRLPRSR